MKTKNKWNFRILIPIIAILVLSTASYAMKNASSNNTSKIDSIGYNSPDKPGESSKEVMLTNDKLEELYNKGYGVRDIEKAAELASQYGISIDEILEMKGPVDYKYKSRTTNNQSSPKESPVIEDTSRDWNEVIADLCILKNAPESRVKEFKIQLNDLRKNGRKLEGEELKESRNSLTKDLIKRYDINNSDVEKCKKQGITEIEEVAYVKKLVLDYNSTIGKVLAFKKEKLYWSEVEKSLGGENK